MLQEELPSAVDAANYLFRLPTKPDLEIVWDNNPPDFAVQINSYIGYWGASRKIHFFPSVFLKVSPSYTKVYKKYIPEFGIEQWAKIAVSHEVPHAMHDALQGYDISKDDNSEYGKMIIFGINEGIAYYGQRHILMRLQEGELWLANLKTLLDRAKTLVNSDDPTNRASGIAMLIGCNNLYRFVQEGDDFYREFVSKKLERPSQEKIEEEIELAYSLADKLRDKEIL